MPKQKPTDEVGTKLVDIDSPYLGPTLKIGRAHTHIQDAEARIAAFRLRNPYLIIARADTETTSGDLLWAFHAKERIPQDLVAVIGDAINNMRSSLDLAICAIIRKRGRSLDEIYFPIGKSKRAIHSTIKSALKNRAGTRLEKFLECELQPYKGGKGDALYRLHRLDILNKHRLIVPVALAVDFAEEKFKPYKVPWKGRTLKGEMVIARTPQEFGHRAGDEAEPEYDIAFDNRTPTLRRKPVIASLWDLWHSTNAALAGLYDYF